MPKRSKPSTRTTSAAAFPRGVKGIYTPTRLTFADRATWLACFGAAIGGVLAAHRRLPNPELVVEYCATVADHGLGVARQRHKPSRSADTS